MARYFVSRHAGAKELARRWALDCVLIDHLDAAVLRHGDEVIGTLPVNLAATSLARLWRNQGRHADATALIQPVYCRFTEGFETSDLQAAKALLDSLR